MSPDGNVVLVRTYRRVLAFARPKGKPLEAAFAVDPCSLPKRPNAKAKQSASPPTGQTYFTISEGAHAPIHHFDTQPASIHHV